MHLIYIKKLKLQPIKLYPTANTHYEVSTKLIWVCLTCAILHMLKKLKKEIFIEKQQLFIKNIHI